jgi:hypothetical protein
LQQRDIQTGLQQRAFTTAATARPPPHLRKIAKSLGG